METTNTTTKQAVNGAIADKALQTAPVTPPVVPAANVITDAALIALAISKGMTAANVTMMKTLGSAPEAIAAAFNAMPDASASTTPAKTQAQELAELRAENERLKQLNTRKRFCTPKVSEKSGGMSVYGVTGQFPVTLYKDQWDYLLLPENVAKLKAFLADPANKFATKPVK